ncbi:DgyrCDS6017 [Dimorphilus gyrociliatus]|uniref:DgyrCDS6017 n=1 Tax=Dimorphilus gyrociliatus TaxID=2664684 RepID=A0A7I8VLQ1_9ANNE|nr:DgyrCDS6017 [Dimorphilus gyrociliatus]
MMNTDGLDRREIFNEMMFGLFNTLGKRKGIGDIRLAEKPGVESHMIIAWEQRVLCTMPNDLKSLYLTSDGLCMSWTSRIAETKYTVGKIKINPLNQLVRIGGISCSNSTVPSLGDVDYDEDDDDNLLKTTNKQPKFDNRSRIFELDSCDSLGKICLVYLDTKPGIQAHNSEIWFLDRSLQWHYLADTFYNYFHLIVVHLGISDWQYLFTSYGLPPQNRKWFELYTPIRLMVSEGNYKKEQQKNVHNHFDPSSVFKEKTKKEKASYKMQTPNSSVGVSKRKPAILSSRTTNAVGRQQNRTK